MLTVTLNQDQERFATEAVAKGRFSTVSDVIQAGVDLLRQAETEVATFVASLEEARAEAERDGFASADELHRDMTKMLDEMGRPRG